MRRFASLAMLRVERTSEDALELMIGALLVVGGMTTVLLATIR